MKQKIASALLVASIPFTTWAAVAFQTGMAESRIDSLAKELAPRIAAERDGSVSRDTRLALRTVFDRPGASESLESLALALPDTDHAGAAERTADGALQLSVETADPDALQAQLARNAVLAGLEPADLAPVEGKPKRVQVSLRSGGR
jgi:hypothetical protein